MTTRDQFIVASLKIMGTKVKVEYKSVVEIAGDTELHGGYFPDRHTIEISTKENEILDTTIHEAMHAWLHISQLYIGVLGDDEHKEEMLVSSFEQNLLPLIKSLIRGYDGHPQTKEDKASVSLKRRRSPAKSPNTNQSPPGSVPKGAYGFPGISFDDTELCENIGNTRDGPA
jgi:hypothetical protein